MSHAMIEKAKMNRVSEVEKDKMKRECAEKQKE